MCVFSIVSFLLRSDGGTGSCREEAWELRGGGGGGRPLESTDQPGGGGGRGGTKKRQNSRKQGDCLKTCVFEGIMKGETLANFLFRIFLASSGHVGVGGAQMTEATFFLSVLRLDAFFAMMESRGKKQGFATRSGA